MTLIVGALVMLTIVSCNEENEANATKKQVTAAKGFKIEDVKIGTGKLAEKGKMIEVHYTGTLTNGKKFDSSLDRNETFKFKLGTGQVIKGWDEGFAGMKVGGVRKLTIPPEMGYGSHAMGSAIPAHSTLLFTVELVNVQ